MFIEFDENGKIKACANFKFNKNAIETNKQVVRSFNGQLVFKEDLDNENENNLIKNENIKKIKEQISNEIYSEYPISKQIDIIARIGEYTDNDFNNMKNFINTKINKYKSLKEQL